MLSQLGYLLHDEQSSLSPSHFGCTRRLRLGMGVDEARSTEDEDEAEMDLTIRE